MEDKVLCNVLNNIKDIHKVSPSKEYTESLVTIGLIDIGWDNNLTKFGKDIRGYLNNKINPW